MKVIKTISLDDLENVDEFLPKSCVHDWEFTGEIYYRTTLLHTYECNLCGACCEIRVENIDPNTGELIGQ